MSINFLKRSTNPERQLLKGLRHQEKIIDELLRDQSDQQEFSKTPAFARYYRLHTPQLGDLIISRTVIVPGGPMRNQARYSVLDQQQSDQISYHWGDSLEPIVRQKVIGEDELQQRDMEFTDLSAISVILKTLPRSAKH